MKFNWISLLLTTAIAFSGCGPKPAQKELRDVELRLGPRLTDTKIDTSQIEVMPSERLFMRPPESPYQGQSAEIFELIETLYDLASREVDPAKRKGFFDLAERLNAAFYADNLNFTRFDADSTTYLELALGVTYDSPPHPLRTLIAGKLTEQQKNLEQGLSGLRLEFPPVPTGQESVENTVLLIAAFLENIPAVLGNNGTKPEIAAQIRGKLDQDYIPLLKASAAELGQISVDGPVDANVEQILKALKGFTVLPANFMAPLLSELEGPKKLGVSLKEARTPARLFRVILDLWTLPNGNREAFRSANEKLYGYLSDLSPEDIALLIQYLDLRIQKEEEPSWQKRQDIGAKISYVYNYHWWFFFKADRVISALDDFGVEKLQSLLTQTVNRALISEFDSKLRSYADLLVRLVTEAIVKEVDGRFKGILVNLKDVLRGQGKKELRSRMFVEESEFAGIEDSSVRLFLGADWKWKATTNKFNEFVRRNLPAKENFILTGARTIGLATSVRMKRLMLREALGLIDPKSYEYQRDVFIAVNRMMAVGGFRHMETDKPRFAGLLRKIQGPGAEYDMDMFNYGEEPGFFAVPDSIIMKAPFEVAAAETRSQGLLASVGGAAEMSRGAGLLMYYMRDWEQNGFDAKMGQQEYEGVKIFPKDAFFALGIGVGSVPLRNLTRNGTLAFGNSGRIYEANVFNQPQDNTSMDCPQPEGIRDPNLPNSKPDPVTAAALVNVTPGGRGDIVDSRDLARFILSADQFIRSTDNVNRTHARPLQAEKDGFKVTLKAVMCGRRSIKTLMIGIGNFLISRMQLADGGFARYYSLKEAKIVPERAFREQNRLQEARFLEDQLLVIQALRKVFDRWQGNVYRDTAVDAYFFLNKSMFDFRTGFYKSVDGDVRPQAVDLRLMAMTIETLIEIAPHVPEASRPQIAALIDVWTRKFLEFGHRTK